MTRTSVSVVEPSARSGRSEVQHHASDERPGHAALEAQHHGHRDAHGEDEVGLDAAHLRGGSARSTRGSAARMAPTAGVRTLIGQSILRLPRPEAPRTRVIGVHKPPRGRVYRGRPASPEAYSDE